MTSMHFIKETFNFFLACKKILALFKYQSIRFPDFLKIFLIIELCFKNVTYFN